MHLLDPSANPVLGRLRGFRQKHRLRSKHYSEIEDFPDDATIPVLGALDGLDFYTNIDQIFICSERFKDLLETNWPEITSHAVDADGTTVYVIEPFTDDGRDVRERWMGRLQPVGLQRAECERSPRGRIA